MKKIFVGILCSALIAAFSGCKPNPDNMDGSYGNNDGIYPFTLLPSTGEVTAITYAPEEVVTQENEYDFESIHKIARNSTAEIGVKSTVEISDRDDILYSVVEAFPDRVTTYIENNSEMTLVWGSEFYVEKNIDGEWYTLEYIELPGNPDRTWTLEGWVVESGGTISEESCWDWDYGHLPSGNYRIIRKCNFNIRDRSPEYMTLAAEFSIS